jgi:hypothetical protein
MMSRLLRLIENMNMQNVAMAAEWQRLVALVSEQYTAIEYRWRVLDQKELALFQWAAELRRMQQQLITGSSGETTEGQDETVHAIVAPLPASASTPTTTEHEEES